MARPRTTAALTALAVGLATGGLSTIGLATVGPLSAATAAGAQPAQNAATPVVHYYVPRSARPSGSGGGIANLFFHDTGASVEQPPHIYLSFWGPEWSTLSAAENAESYTTGFSTSLGGSGWLATAHQYCQNVPAATVTCSAVAGAVNIDTAGQQLGGAFNDPTAVPSHPSNADIVAAAERLAVHFGFDDPNGLYMVLTPSGKSQRGFGTSFCAYHGATSTTQGTTLAFSYVPYQPDSAACNDNPGNLPFGGFSISAGHEYAEAMTDPVPGTGWTDKHGSEIGDKCETVLATISLNSASYAVQDLWSNAAPGCVLTSS